MELLSINLGRKQTIKTGRREYETGIYKTPVTSPIQVTLQGLSGDTVVNTRYHGGPDQALYLYGKPDYDWWERELGQELLPGTFGDNLTLTGLESGRINIGDRFVIGQVCLEVTAPRIPCGTLGGRMGSQTFVKRFLEAGRLGLYCRVMDQGEVQAGAPVVYQPFAGPNILAADLYWGAAADGLTAVEIKQRLAVPIAERARKNLEKQLKQLN